ncbi:hypothetical protein Tsubulata_046667 [Turnera subulata]|uniref:DUF4283 domain-containing protein n=1 Tax=Turnera subulata TaxID=218843 RepID=A0A9Q0JR50_9ROSI|nr:hypothetical protein Tsubulata_046667 [Turnera subulata]
MGFENGIPTLNLSPSFQKKAKNKFEKKQDYIHSLVCGPWSVFNSVLCVFPWRSDFSTTAGRVEKAVVWVRFPDFPLHIYHSSILNTLGDLVGETVKIDQARREHQRGRFAKIAVEVDLTKPLKGTIVFQGKEQKVIYEGLSTLCYYFGKIDHVMAVCPLMTQHSTPTPTSPTNSTGVVIEPSHKRKEPEESSSFGRQGVIPEVGAWMNVPVRSRPFQQCRSTTPQVAPIKAHGTTEGSRFTVLATDLDKEGGVEEPIQDGIGPWIIVASSKQPKPRKALKKFSSNNFQAQKPDKNTKQPNPTANPRAPLLDVSNTLSKPTPTPPRVLESPKPSIPTSPSLRNNPESLIFVPQQPVKLFINSKTYPSTLPAQQHTSQIRQLTIVPADSTPLNMVLSKEEAESAAELSKQVITSSSLTHSSLQQTRPKHKPPDLNPIDGETPNAQSTSKARLRGITIKKTKLPSYNKCGKRANLGLVTEEEEDLSDDEEILMEVSEPTVLQDIDPDQGHPSPFPNLVL